MTELLKKPPGSLFLESQCSSQRAAGAQAYTCRRKWRLACCSGSTRCQLTRRGARSLRYLSRAWHTVNIQRVGLSGRRSYESAKKAQKSTHGMMEVVGAVYGFEFRLLVTDTSKLEQLQPAVQPAEACPTASTNPNFYNLFTLTLILP